MQPNEFVTSDTHFGHANVIKYSNRPFESAEDMDEQLIERWNAKVPVRAIVYHLGDFAFSRPERVRQIVSRLHGQIRLVQGNHDRVLKKDKSLIGLFEWVKDYHESKTPDGTKVVMCHYAFQVWNKSHYGSWCLHGHSHGTLKSGSGIKRLDVGVDTHPNYEPYSYHEIKREMDARGVRAVDHHVEGGR